MDLMKFVQRGTALSGIYSRQIEDRLAKQKAHDQYQINALEGCRALWIKCIKIDQTRAWMSISEQDKGLLNGLVALLTTAAVAKMHATNGSLDSPEISVIRGAISAATQCADGGSIISVADAKAFNIACEHAQTIFETCELGAIKHAAMQMHAYAREANQVH
jgi:hypothetical protein